jgi:quinol monooxygenase YgiN
MSNKNLDQLRSLYKKAVEEWIQAIRAEEDLATPDHSMLAWEKWDDAHLAEHAAHQKFTAAREAYKDALRELNIGI